MNDGPKEGYAFVVDTDAYAGNFEREMTAYLTGQIGECGVGEELVEELEINFDNVLQVPDEHACYRPTSCWVEPRTGNYNAVAIFFESTPTKEQIEFMKERVKSFDKIRKEKGYTKNFIQKNPEIKILGFRLLKFNQKIKEIEV